MNKKLGVSLILMALSFHSSADECTKQIDGYLEGLEFGLGIPQASVKRKNVARTKITRIEALRKSKTDCEIKAFIPELAQTDAAIKRATEFAK